MEVSRKVLPVLGGAEYWALAVLEPGRRSAIAAAKARLAVERRGRAKKCIDVRRIGL